MTSRNVNLPDVLHQAIDYLTRDLHTACPAIVKKYDAAKQTVDAQPVVRREGRDENGEKVVDDPPVVPAVPVAFPRAGGYFISFPIAVGDVVLLVYSEREIGAWRDSGQLSDPGDEGRHTMAGAVAIPGLFDVKHALAGADAGTGHLVIGKEGGVQIHVDGSSVQLGAAGGNFVALSNLVQSALDSIRTSFNSHIHAETGGNTAPPTTPMSALGPVAATKAKAT